MRWLVALVALAACTGPRARPGGGEPPKRAVLFVTSDLRGALEPCGCSEHMLGGLPRLAHLVDAARAEGGPVFLFDAGDTLFGQSSFPPEAVSQQERKAKAIAEALRVMGLAAWAPAHLDDARGRPFRDAFGLPALADDGGPGALRLFDAGGHQVAVLAAADAEAMARLGARARAQGARFVVAVLERPFLEAFQASQREGLPADLVLAHPHAGPSLEESRLAGGAVKVAQVQGKGRAVLRVDLALRDAPLEWLDTPADRERELAALDARVELLRLQVNEPLLDAALLGLRRAKLAEVAARREALAAAPLRLPDEKSAAAARFVRVEASLPQLPAVRAVVEAYDADVGRMNLAWAKEHGQDCDAPAPGRPGYAGNDACEACHAEAFEVYRAGKHPQAYATLEKTGRQYHYDCVGCHVDGWQQVGGVCRLDRVQGRALVGCESCHGPGSAHSADPEKQRLYLANEVAACVRCHDRENSPQFDFEGYLKKVVGPGHGMKADGGAAAPGAPRQDGGVTAPGPTAADCGVSRPAATAPRAGVAAPAALAAADGGVSGRGAAARDRARP